MSLEKSMDKLKSKIKDRWEEIGGHCGDERGSRDRSIDKKGMERK